MKTTTTFNSSQYGVTAEQLENHYGANNYNSIILQDISFEMAGYGQWKVTSKWVLDGTDHTHVVRTTNSSLYDAWKSLMRGDFEAGDDGYESEDELVECILRLVDFEG